MKAGWLLYRNTGSFPLAKSVEPNKSSGPRDYIRNFDALVY